MVKLISFHRLNRMKCKIIKRIEYILTRITILTFLYMLIEIPLGIAFYSGTRQHEDFPKLLFSLFMSISIFLMQEHNTKEYEKFLYIMKKYLCCCWNVDILKGLTIEQELQESMEDNNNQQDQTDYNTHDISENHAKIPNIANQLSIESVV